MHQSGSWFARLAAAVLLLAALVAPISQPSKAASSAGDLTQMSLEELMNMQVTSASKKPEKLSDAPAAAFVITRDDIERFGYQTLSAALRQISGIYMSDDRTYNYIGVRGYSRPGDYNSRILLLINGMRINDPQWGMAPIGDDLPINIKSIERIEVVKGPGSALWGGNAVLAVVNIITKQAADIRGTNVVQRFGSEPSKESYAEYGSRDPSGLQIAASSTSSQSDGQRSIYFAEFDDPATNNGNAVNVDGETISNGYFSASYKDLKLLVNTGIRRKGNPTGSYGTVFNDPGNKTDDRRTYGELSYERTISPGHNGKLLLRAYSGSYDYLADFISDWGYPTYATNVDVGSTKWWGSEARYSTDLSPRLSLTSGVEYLSSYRMFYQNYDAPPYYQQYLERDHPFHAVSYYSQADIKLSPKLRLLAGTRLDDYSNIGATWSPRGALIYRPNEPTTLKLLCGKAFRAPLDYEVYYGVTNSGLGAESMTTTELVWERELGSNTRLVANLFRFDLDDIISLVTLGDDSHAFLNQGSVTSEGLEIQLDSRMASDVIGHFGLSLLRAEEVGSNARISNSPRCVLTGGISLPLWSHRLYLTPEMQLVGSRYTDAGVKIDTSTIANMIVATTGGARLGLRVGVYNLFDTTSYTPATTGFAQNLIPQQGRTVQMETSYQF